MSPNDATLLNFSYLVILISSAMLVVPVLLRKSDVFTAWNFFLVGVLMFNGLSGINCVNHSHYLDSYRTSDYQKYYLGSVVFFATITLTYYFLPLPRRLAGKSFLKWPELTSSSAPVIVLPLAAMVVFQVVPLPVPGLQQMLFQASLCAPTIALACAFVAWYRSPSNLFLLMLVGATGLAALFGSISGGTSRRYLISTLAAVPISLYWIWLRNKTTPIMIGWLAAALAAAIPVLMGYTLIRHSTRETAGTAVERYSQLINNLPNAIKEGGSLEGFMGQDSVEAAILTIHMLNNGAKNIEVTPFYSIVYIATNPIPRSLWPDKPISLGITLPKRSGISSRGINFNIGVNVIGQCYYDGGLIIHVLYAIGFGAFLRFIDELLVRQPGNPYVVGTLVAMSGQILGWPRGGIETMGLQIIMVFAMMVLIWWLGRMFIGEGMTFPRTDHIDRVPIPKPTGSKNQHQPLHPSPRPLYGGH